MEQQSQPAAKAPRQGQRHGGWQCTCMVLHASAAPRLLQAGLPLPAVPQLWPVSESLGIEHNQGPAILCVNDPGPLGSLLALQGTLSPRFSHHSSSPVVLSLCCASESPTAFQGDPSHSLGEGSSTAGYLNFPGDCKHRSSLHLGQCFPNSVVHVTPPDHRLSFSRWGRASGRDQHLQFLELLRAPPRPVEWDLRFTLSDSCLC